jgi:hypothetical protein
MYRVALGQVKCDKRNFDREIRESVEASRTTMTALFFAVTEIHTVLFVDGNGLIRGQWLYSK